MQMQQRLPVKGIGCAGAKAKNAVAHRVVAPRAAGGVVTKASQNVSRVSSCAGLELSSSLERVSLQHSSSFCFAQATSALLHAPAPQPDAEARIKASKRIVMLGCRPSPAPGTAANPSQS